MSGDNNSSKNAPAQEGWSGVHRWVSSCFWLHLGTQLIGWCCWHSVQVFPPQWEHAPVSLPHLKIPNNPLVLKSLFKDLLLKDPSLRQLPDILNSCVAWMYVTRPKITHWSPNLQGDSIRRWGVGKVIRSGLRLLPLYKRLYRAFCLLHHVSTQQKQTSSLSLNFWSLILWK
jgi:hypothetical protein